MEGLQKEVAQQVAGLQQRSLKGMREEVKKEGKRLEALYEAQVTQPLTASCLRRIRDSDRLGMGIHACMNEYTAGSHLYH